MARKKTGDSELDAYISTRPASTPEAERQRMRALAMAVSEKRMREGTASAQEIVFWLNDASEERELKIKKLEKENELLKAKTDNINSSTGAIEDYKAVIRAMKICTGEEDADDYGDYDEY